MIPIRQFNKIQVLKIKDCLENKKTIHLGTNNGAGGTSNGAGGTTVRIGGTNDGAGGT
jgi:hypothetical protein